MEVYSNPATRFVAGFIGSPAMNFLKVELSKIDMKIRVPAGGSYELGIRPEAVRVTESEGTTSGKATVVEHLGNRTLVYMQLADGTPIIAQDGGRSQVSPGDVVNVSFDTSELHLFDTGGKSYHGDRQDA